MAEVKKYENYEKLMKVIDNLKTKEGAYSKEQNMVIELIQLFPKAVKMYAEQVLSTTLNVLDVTIDEYVYKVIDYAITRWVDSPAAKMDMGSLNLFLKVLNYEYEGNKADNIYDYSALYNFYTILYNCADEALPEYTDIDQDDEDCNLKFIGAEDMIPELVDENNALYLGHDEYYCDLRRKDDINLFNKFLEIIKNDDNPKAIRLANLKNNIQSNLEYFYDQIGITDKTIPSIADFVVITAIKMYDSIASYAFVSLDKEKDEIMAMVYDNEVNISVNRLYELCDIIWKRVKSVSYMVTDPFTNTITDFNDLFKD